MAARDRKRPAARQRTAGSPGSTRSNIVAWLSGGVAVAVLATIAVVAAGYDAREAPREEPNVWVMRSGGQQYARVNTLTGEIDTVRKVEDPNAVLQSGAAGVVLSHGNARVWNIDPMLPTDLSSDAAPETAGQEPAAHAAAAAQEQSGTATAMRAPDGTRDTIAAGDAVVFRSDDGEVYLSRFGTAAIGAASELSEPMLLDPFAEERAELSRQQAEAPAEDGEAQQEELAGFFADAVAVDAEGNLVMFSAAAAQLRWYDITQGEFTRTEETPADIDPDGVQLAIVAGTWALFEPDSGKVWLPGATTAIEIEVAAGARLQASSTESAGNDVLIADAKGLWRVTGREAKRDVAFSGAAAQPIQLGSERYAAWLGQSDARLWSSTGDEIPLQLDPAQKLPGEPAPVIRTNGTAALVAETVTGMMWTVPDGTLIPVEQWKLVDPPKDRSGTVVVNDVTEQEPPVAVPDAFGVRAGESTLLPVLLNDYDPNRKDVLTIVPDGLADGLPPSFGTLSILPDSQSLVVQPTKEATGTATFSYRITDGVNLSEPATVTLTVMGSEINTGPQWCPVEGCQRAWPSPELAPGGTLVFPVLDGWVDPEGDPMMLESARLANTDDPVRVLVTADGKLALRHADSNAPDSDVVVTLRVADAHGVATERDMTVQIRSNAKAEFSPIATTVVLDQPSLLRPLSRIVGGSGSYALVDAAVQSGTAEANVNVGAGTIEIKAAQTGVSLIAITARDTGTDAEISGVLRVTAVETRQKLGLPPLRAFVRPLADTTIEVLDAVPGANARALVVRGAEVVDGELRADVLDHAQVRVSGSTPDGTPGRIGSADIAIEEAGDISTARLTVFQVPETGEGGAIAVADNITVRAGAVADIPVLDNDVSPPGQRLVLHPEINGSGAKGELAFASGNTLRYLAPTEPGNYNLSYTTYGASTPELSDTGQVRVTVLPREGNRNPQPTSLTLRIAPGERSTVQVPLSGVDPDGDRVRLIGVSASEDPQLTAMLAPRSSAIQVEASKNAKPGVQLLSYSVRDEYGGEATGRLRVIVTDASRSGAPVAFSDYVRLVKGTTTPAVIHPLDNDFDPAGGTLELVDVVPNVSGGKDSEQYRKLAERLDVSKIADGKVMVSGGDELGTVSYRYTVRSSESSSTAEGLIVVQVSARVGQQAPTIKDTVLSARDRAELERGGVDVVTDRVYWSAGDASSLKLSVWGSTADRFSAEGKRITGQYRAEGDLVPFKLAGKDLTGAEVESFGFLVIPPLDELRLTLKPGLAPLSVDENKSVEAALADVVDLAAGDSAEFRTDAGFPTQRSQASCQATGTSGLRYSAGKEGPWTDTCLISVKLTEQKTWTQLSVPVQIRPNEPVAELDPLTRTVSPGESETINLVDMVRWQGGREGNTRDLRFQVAGGGSSFQVTPAGAQVTVTADAAAAPGREEVLSITVLGGTGAQAPLTLRVGEAPKTLPRAGTVQLSCRVGESCSTRLIGVAGEFDPFAGKQGGGLKLDAVSAGDCRVAGFQAAGDSVTATWPNGAGGTGGKCTATFTVRDAQGRIGEGGRIELDAAGVPRAPVEVKATSAGSSSVQLTIALSSEASHPAVTGVELLADGSPAGSCEYGGGGSAVCTADAPAGIDKARTYTARAVNAAGSSEASSSAARTWAYQPPQPPSISGGEPMHWADNTTASGVGRTKVVIGQSSAASRVLTVDGAQREIREDGVYELAPGSHSFSVVSVDSAASLPPGYTGSDGGQGSAGTLAANVIGAPTAPGSVGLSLNGPNETSWAFDTAGFGKNGGDELSFTFGLAQGQGAPACTGSSQSGSGLTKFRYYTGAVCASNSYGKTVAVPSGSVYTGGVVPPPNAVNYTINPAPDFATTATTASYGAIAPAVGSMVNIEGGVIVWEGGAFAPSAANPNARAQQCTAGNVKCSDWTVVGPPAGLTPFSVTWNTTSCIDPASDPGTWTSAVTVAGSPGATFVLSQVVGTQDVLLTWQGGGYGNVTFTGKLCAPTPPDPDPGDGSGGEGSGG